MIINENRPSLSLLYGPPGCGKTTLALQMCSDKKKSLYITTEQKASLIIRIAERIKGDNKPEIIESRDAEEIVELVRGSSADFVIIDSLQGIKSIDLGYMVASAQSIQNEMLDQLYEISWTSEKNIILVNHQTKQAWMRGSRYAEHMVDLVAKMGSDHSLVITKSRYEATPIKIALEMKPDGLKEKLTNI